jgi:type IV pilus assembly protein PilV
VNAPNFRIARNARCSGPAGQRGFTLVEALISVVIMSIGLLGVAALQTRSLGSTNISSKRSQAVLLAGDLADRMRANRVAADVAAASNYGNIAAADNACRAIHYNHTHNVGACTAVQLAADDLADWSAQIAALLPSGSGVVCRDSTPNDGTVAAPACDGNGNAFAIKIFWSEKTDNSSTAAVQPLRFSLLVRP